MQNVDIIAVCNNTLYHPAKFQINIPNHLKMAFERNL